MSSNSVGALKKFLEQFDDDFVVYGYEEVGGIDMGDGPSAIVVIGDKDDSGGTFPTGDYAWTSRREPRIDTGKKTGP